MSFTPVGNKNDAQIFLTVKADTRKGIEKKGQKMFTHIFGYECTSKRLRRQSHIQ